MFDPNEFFQLASQLAKASALAGITPESMRRAAIGRAYYACFLTAREQLFGPDGVGGTKAQYKKYGIYKANGSHDRIIKAVAVSYKASPRVTPGGAKRLADQLGDLKALRLQADYTLDPSNTETQKLFTKYAVSDWDGLASHALALASNLLPALKVLPRLP